MRWRVAPRPQDGHAAPPWSSTIRSVDALVILLVVLLIVVIWRGPKTLPQIGAMLGRGVKAARDEARGIRSDDTEPDEPSAK